MFAPDLTARVKEQVQDMCARKRHAVRFEYVTDRGSLEMVPSDDGFTFTVTQKQNKLPETKRANSSGNGTPTEPPVPKRLRLAPRLKRQLSEQQHPQTDMCNVHTDSRLAHRSSLQKDNAEPKKTHIERLLPETKAPSVIEIDDDDDDDDIGSGEDAMTPPVTHALVFPQNDDIYVAAPQVMSASSFSSRSQSIEEEEEEAASMEPLPNRLEALLQTHLPRVLLLLVCEYSRRHTFTLELNEDRECTLVRTSHRAYAGRIAIVDDDDNNNKNNKCEHITAFALAQDGLFFYIQDNDFYITDLSRLSEQNWWASSLPATTLPSKALYADTMRRILIPKNPVLYPAIHGRRLKLFLLPKSHTSPFIKTRPEEAANTSLAYTPLGSEEEEKGDGEEKKGKEEEEAETKTEYRDILAATNHTLWAVTLHHSGCLAFSEFDPLHNKWSKLLVKFSKRMPYLATCGSCFVILDKGDTGTKDKSLRNDAVGKESLRAPARLYSYNHDPSFSLDVSPLVCAPAGVLDLRDGHTFAVFGTQASAFASSDASRMDDGGGEKKRNKKKKKKSSLLFGKKQDPIICVLAFYDTRNITRPANIKHGLLSLPPDCGNSISLSYDPVIHTLFLTDGRHVWTAEVDLLSWLSTAPSFVEETSLPAIPLSAYRLSHATRSDTLYSQFL